ncbi:TnsA endonuclease N-terminal domain-containing protein [Klebsiella oxytoca]|uniref:TnsA endonuclease N-terminal domain-containing protein n=1 Tax=Klebsiella oxytoca TaxID=571 RepID=UPI003570F820
MNSILTLESSLEFNACFHLEYSTAVKTFEAQPEGFYYNFDGQICSYTPDFRVTDYSENSYYLEVKPSKRVIHSDFKERFFAQQQAAIDLSTQLKLITEKQICVEPILNNLMLIHRYAGFQSVTKLHGQIIIILKKSNKTTIYRLCRITGANEGDIIASALSLISCGKLKSDIVTQKFSSNSQVWIE